MKKFKVFFKVFGIKFKLAVTVGFFASVLGISSYYVFEGNPEAKRSSKIELNSLILPTEKAVEIVVKGEPTIKMIKVARLAANKAGIDASIILGVMDAESRFNQKAYRACPKNSTYDSIGLMQITAPVFEFIQKREKNPSVLKDHDMFSIDANIFVGAMYISYLKGYYMKKKYSEQDALVLALSAYSKGPGKVSSVDKARKSKYVSYILKASTKYVNAD